MFNWKGQEAFFKSKTVQNAKDGLEKFGGLEKRKQPKSIEDFNKEEQKKREEKKKLAEEKAAKKKTTLFITKNGKLR